MRTNTHDAQMLLQTFRLIQNEAQKVCVCGHGAQRKAKADAWAECRRVSIEKSSGSSGNEGVAEMNESAKRSGGLSGPGTLSATAA